MKYKGYELPTVEELASVVSKHQTFMEAYDLNEDVLRLYVSESAWTVSSGVVYFDPQQKNTNICVVQKINTRSPKGWARLLLADMRHTITTTEKLNGAEC